MIGFWWLSHMQDVLAAASDEQLTKLSELSQAELTKRESMTKTGIKCRQKRAVERVHRSLIQARLNDQPKDERAS